MYETDPAAELRQRVVAAGFTMKDVCARAQVAESTPVRWARWEPKLSTIRKLHAALDEMIQADGAPREQAAASAEA